MSIDPPFVSRVGIIGDVHGEDKALEAVLGFLHASPPCNAILCTGDVIGKNGSGDTDRCCALLQEDGVLTVRGNHDRWFCENDGDPLMKTLGLDHPDVSPNSRAFLHSLPSTRAFATPCGPLLLCHGIGTDDSVRVFPETPDEEALSLLQADPTLCAGRVRFVVGGHTHVPMFRPLPDGLPVLVNPGTLHWGYECGFIVADFERGSVDFFRIDHDAGLAITPGPAYESLASIAEAP